MNFDQFFYNTGTYYALLIIFIVPVTYAWKDELERKTQKALNKVLGHMSVPSSQQGPREMKQIGQFDHLEDEEVKYYIIGSFIVMYNDICVSYYSL